MIDSCCIKFEDAIRDGVSVSIHDFLDRVPDLLRKRLFVELLRLQLDYRREERHQSILARRYPSFEREIASVLSDTQPVRRIQLSPGDQLGRYRVLEGLGEGTFSHVYKAQDLELDRFVAIKVPMCHEYQQSEDAAISPGFLPPGKTIGHIHV
ncbi:MAG: hypothetical protein AAFP69_23155, partial [Planctomycetota bacterium]